MSEDIFYSMWMKKFNMNLPSSDEAELFSSEQVCNYIPSFTFYQYFNQ